MFKTAILGPVATKVSVVKECIECDEASNGVATEGCTGFGPGCLGLKSAAGPAASSAEDLDVHLSAPEPKAT